MECRHALQLICGATTADSLTAAQCCSLARRRHVTRSDGFGVAYALHVTAASAFSDCCKEKQLHSVALSACIKRAHCQTHWTGTVFWAQLSRTAQPTLLCCNNKMQMQPCFSHAAQSKDSHAPCGSKLLCTHLAPLCVPCTFAMS